MTKSHRDSGALDGDLVSFNGVDGATGEYLLPAMTTRQIAGIVQGTAALASPASRRRDGGHLAALRRWVESVCRDHLGPREGVDPRDLAQAGWGVVFARDADPAVVEALGRLLEHRRLQATRQDERHFRIFSGENGYRPGEEKWDFLNRHQAGFGPADPAIVPYYLLLVGSPESIPFRFQYELDVEYAVGRLDLASAESYAAYADAVIAAEGRAVPRPRAAFFGVRNPDDLATHQSADFLVEPLAEAVDREHPGWQVDLVLGEETTKSRLSQLLGGPGTPAFLFTASHGLGFPHGHPRQLSHQGALLCQDWPGPRARTGKGVPEDQYFAGTDLGADARLHGLVAFHFSCYGAGTTRLDGFAHRAEGPPKLRAPHDFVADLPRRLLGHPAGGALAIVAHVEQCWGYSYLGMEGGERLQTFESTMKRLFEGHPVGSAMDYFNRRYAEVATMLSAELQSLRYGKTPDDRKLTRLWTAENDARSYIVLGDPAVRLPRHES